MSSEAVLIGSKGRENDDLIQELIQRIQSVLRAKETKYVVLNVLKDNLAAVTALLPGVKSPSVVPLAEPDWVAVHTVIPERDFWDRISQLKQAAHKALW
jgi:ATP phosphoribosyltransferase